jgi:hypothetical protein
MPADAFGISNEYVNPVDSVLLISATGGDQSLAKFNDDCLIEMLLEENKCAGLNNEKDISKNANKNNCNIICFTHSLENK